MIDRPILMNGEMVRATRADRKTQTRRLLRHELSKGDWPEFWRPARPGVWNALDAETNEEIQIASPYGVPGQDRLWVREAFIEASCRACEVGEATNVMQAGHTCGLPKSCYYRADDEGREGPWTPSIHMPRWASRLTLEVTGVRVERLQDISEEDARAEGVMPWSQADVERIACPCGPDGPEENPGPHVDGCAWGVDDEIDPDIEPHRAAFALLWNRINGKRAPWASNPWIWVVSFRRAT